MKHKKRTLILTILFTIAAAGVTNAFLLEIKHFRNSNLGTLLNTAPQSIGSESGSSLPSVPAVTHKAQETALEVTVAAAQSKVNESEPIDVISSGSEDNQSLVKDRPPVPEPGTMVLLGISLITAAGYMRRVNKSR